MVALGRLMSWELVAFASLLTVLVVYQLLTGRINTRGLLRIKSGRRTISPARIQLLVITALAAAASLRGFADQAQKGLRSTRQETVES